MNLQSHPAFEQRANAGWGGHASRHRRERITSSLLGKDDGEIRCPRVIRIGFDLQEGQDPLSHLHELLVDEGFDKPEDLRQVVAIALGNAGYEAIEACDGQDALAKLTGRKIHLMVSDVNMPNMDGITFLKKLREHPSYKFPPVIMLTTEAGEDKKTEGQAAGARAWVVKPFKPEQLLVAVSKLILP